MNDNVTSLTKHPIDPNNELQEHKPFFRAALRGGCTLPGCTCSSDPYISVSDGKIVYRVLLSREDARALLCGDVITIDNLLVGTP